MWRRDTVLVGLKVGGNTMRIRIGRNIVEQDGIVKCRIKRHGKYIERTAPYQGNQAYSKTRDGAVKPKPALTKWLAEMERALAEKRFDSLRACRARGGTPTIAEILRLYNKFCSERNLLTGSPSTKTIGANEACLKRIVTQLGLSTSDRVDKLSPDAIRKWVAGIAEQHDKGEARDKAIYVANSVLQQARSVFSLWLVNEYDKAGLSIPPDVRKWPRFSGVWRPTYKDPPGDLKRVTISKAADLRKEQPSVWVLYWLLLNFGMRPGDALRLTWSNFRAIAGDSTGRRYLVLKPNKTRKCSRIVTIPVDETVWSELTLTRPVDQDPDERIVQGGRKTLNALNAWLRSIGWTRDNGYFKAAYEIRKLFTSAVRNTYGVQLASDYCGSSVRMVEQYYAATYTERMPTISPAKIIMETKQAQPV